METAWKGIMGLVLITILVFAGVGLETSSINSKAADSFAASCISRIENSNYAPTVIASCKKDAKDHGYVLTVKTYQPNNTGRTEYGTIDLKYYFTIPIIGLKQEHHIHGDIR